MKENINTEKHWDNRYGVLDHRKIVCGNHRLLYNEIARIVIEKRPNNVLDLGSGIGTVPWYLKNIIDYNLENIEFGYYCVDFSDVALKKAKEVDENIVTIKSRIDIEIKNKLLTKKKFDIVICAEVLEHITNYVTTINQIKKYLSGISIVTVPKDRINIKEHYHKVIIKDEIVGYHKICGLNVLEIIEVDLWRIIISEVSK